MKYCLATLSSNKAEARLDFGKHHIVLFGEEMLYFHPETAQQSRSRKARSVVVEPGHEYLVRGIVHGNQAVQGDMMLSPTKGFVEKHKILIARVLVNTQPTNAVPLHLLTLATGLSPSKKVPSQASSSRPKFCPRSAPQQRQSS